MKPLALTPQIEAPAGPRRAWRALWYRRLALGELSQLYGRWAGSEIVAAALSNLALGAVSETAKTSRIIPPNNAQKNTVHQKSTAPRTTRSDDVRRLTSLPRKTLEALSPRRSNPARWEIPTAVTATKKVTLALRNFWLEPAANAFAKDEIEMAVVPSLVFGSA